MLKKPRVTVVGSGVVGLTCALELASTHTVTILARDMPGDPDSASWSSPWAGALWLGHDGATLEQQKLQRLAFEKFAYLAEHHREETSCVKMGAWDYQEKYDDPNQVSIWYRFLPDFRVATKDEYKGPGCCFRYSTIVMTPKVYLKWLKDECEKSGVVFKRSEVRSLGQAADLAPCDVIVNASGNGAKFLADVADDDCVQVRGQMLLVKGDCPELVSLHAKEWSSYTYVTPRGDGTMILGGIKEYGCTDPNPYEWLRRDIHTRCRKILPEYVPERYEDLDVIQDIVGIRPERKGGPRIEKQDIDGLNVVHAYGMTGGGFVYSWGLAGKVVGLVGEYSGVMPAAAKEGLV